MCLGADRIVIILGFLVIICVAGHDCCSKRKGAAFALSVNLVFCRFFGSKGIENGVFVDLVHLFDIRITFRFVGLGLICDQEYVFTMKVLISF